jgi:hypothetical protein
MLVGFSASVISGLESYGWAGTARSLVSSDPHVELDGEFPLATFGGGVSAGNKGFT